MNPPPSTNCNKSDLNYCKTGNVYEIIKLTFLTKSLHSLTFLPNWYLRTLGKMLLLAIYQFSSIMQASFL